MTTIINTPPSSTEDSSSAGMVVGIVLGALIVVLLVIVGLRYYGGRAYMSNTAPSQAGLPALGGGTTVVNVAAPAAPANGAGAATGNGY